MSVFSWSVKPNVAVTLAVTLLFGGCSTATPSTVPSASPSASAAIATATPLPTIATGFGRFSGRLTDAATGKPIAEGCIVIATGGSCQPASPRTDADGFWWIDLPVNIDWDFAWTKDGYQPEKKRLHSTPGEQAIPIALTPTS